MNFSSMQRMNQNRDWADYYFDYDEFKKLVANFKSECNNNLI